MVADPDFDASLDQGLSDVGLDVREADGEVRLQRDDVFHLRAQESGDLGLFAARPRRPHRKPGNADDPCILAERVQHLGRLLSQADDTLGVHGLRDSSGGKCTRGGKAGRGLPGSWSKVTKLHEKSVPPALEVVAGTDAIQ